MSEVPGRIGIVGGGMLGLTLALRLRQAGAEVAVFEAASDWGGLASAWTLGDVVWDRHYHVILMSDSRLRNLLRELGLDEEIEWATTKTGFFTDGKLHSLSSSLEFLRFPPLNLLDKTRLAATILHASRISDGRPLEQIPVVDWLTKWSGRRVVDKIWRPLLRCKLGDDYEEASAAFIWAIVRRMYAARRSGLKREMFGCVRGGYARILDAFTTKLAELGVELHLESRVKRIVGDGPGAAIEFADGGRRDFDQAIVTPAAPLASRLVPELHEAEKARLTNVSYRGIVCASLLLKRPLSPYYVTNITEDWAPFTGVIEMTALVDPKRFGGRSLVYLPKYVAPDDPLFGAADEEIRSRFLAGLKRMHPTFDEVDVLAFRVSRVKYVFAATTLDYSANLPPMRTGVPGVWLANSAHIVNGTLNVDETVGLAEHVAERVLAAPTPTPAAAP